MLDFTEKKVLVTGASSGIGKATAIMCASLGAYVFITGRNKDRLNECKNECIKQNGKAEIIPCELSNPNEIEKLVAHLPKLNGCVLNAGISKVIPVKFIKQSDINEIFSVNTQAQILMFNELLRQKKLDLGCSVVFTASMAALGEVAIGTSLYAASKSALCAFSKNAALELAGKGIRCNTVCPGVVETNLTDGLHSFESDSNGNIKKYPLGRYGKPDDIAHAIAFLLSDISSWITGIDLIIDGGLHLKR